MKYLKSYDLPRFLYESVFFHTVSDRKKFEISEKICSLAEHILQSLRNRMVKTVFENSKFLMFKIGPKTFCSYVLPRGQKFSDRFTLKTSNFQNPF